MISSTESLEPTDSLPRRAPAQDPPGIRISRPSKSKVDARVILNSSNSTAAHMSASSTDRSNRRSSYGNHSEVDANHPRLDFHISVQEKMDYRTDKEEEDKENSKIEPSNLTSISRNSKDSSEQSNASSSRSSNEFWATLSVYAVSAVVASAGSNNEMKQAAANAAAKSLLEDGQAMERINALRLEQQQEGSRNGSSADGSSTKKPKAKPHLKISRRTIHHAASKASMAALQSGAEQKVVALVSEAIVKWGESMLEETNGAVLFSPQVTSSKDTKSTLPSSHSLSSRSSKPSSIAHRVVVSLRGQHHKQRRLQRQPDDGTVHNTSTLNFLSKGVDRYATGMDSVTDPRDIRVASKESSLSAVPNNDVCYPSSLSSQCSRQNQHSGIGADDMPVSGIHRETSHCDSILANIKTNESEQKQDDSLTAADVIQQSLGEPERSARDCDKSDKRGKGNSERDMRPEQNMHSKQSPHAKHDGLQKLRVFDYEKEKTKDWECIEMQQLRLELARLRVAEKENAIEKEKARAVKDAEDKSQMEHDLRMKTLRGELHQQFRKEKESDMYRLRIKMQQQQAEMTLLKRELAKKSAKGQHHLVRDWDDSWNESSISTHDRYSAPPRSNVLASPSIPPPARSNLKMASPKHFTINELYGDKTVPSDGTGGCQIHTMTTTGDTFHGNEVVLSDSRHSALSSMSPPDGFPSTRRDKSSDNNFVGSKAGSTLSSSVRFSPITEVVEEFHTPSYSALSSTSVPSSADFASAPQGGSLGNNFVVSMVESTLSSHACSSHSAPSSKCFLIQEEHGSTVAECHKISSHRDSTGSIADNAQHFPTVGADGGEASATEETAIEVVLTSTESATNKMKNGLKGLFIRKGTVRNDGSSPAPSTKSKKVTTGRLRGMIARAVQRRLRAKSQRSEKASNVVAPAKSDATTATVSQESKGEGKREIVSEARMDSNPNCHSQGSSFQECVVKDRKNKVVDMHLLPPANVPMETHVSGARVNTITENGNKTPQSSVAQSILEQTQTIVSYFGVEIPDREVASQETPHLPSSIPMHPRYTSRRSVYIADVIQSHLTNDSSDESSKHSWVGTVLSRFARGELVDNVTNNSG